MADYKATLSYLESLPTEGFHLYSLGCLNTYFRLDEFLKKGKARLINDRILYLGGHTSKQDKTLVYDFKEEDAQILKELQEKSVVYSRQKLPLEKETDFEETSYNLPELFNRENYSSKSWRSKINYPLKWLDNLEVTIRPYVDDDYEEVVALFRKWADDKLADPKVFKMMFPEKRYFRCIEACTKNKPQQTKGFFKTSVNQSHKDYKGFTIIHEGRIQGFECIATQEDHAFVLFRFGDPESLSRLRFSASIKIFKDLLDEGFNTCNVGVPLPGGLKQFKERLPFTMKKAYKYSRL